MPAAFRLNRAFDQGKSQPSGLSPIGSLLEHFAGLPPCLLVLLLAMTSLGFAILSETLGLIFFGSLGVIGCPCYLPAGFHAVLAKRFRTLGMYAIALSAISHSLIYDSFLVLAIIIPTLNLWKAGYIGLRDACVNDRMDFYKGIAWILIGSATASNGIACWLGQQQPNVPTFFMGTVWWLFGDLLGLSIFYFDINRTRTTTLSKFCRIAIRNAAPNTIANMFRNESMTEVEDIRLTELCDNSVSKILQELEKYGHAPIECGPLGYEASLTIVLRRARIRVMAILFYRSIVKYLCSCFV